MQVNYIKKKIKKTEAASDLIGNKMENKITNRSQQNN